MFSENYTQIPPELIGELKTVLVSSVMEIINARIDKSVSGASYLVIPFMGDKFRFAILSELSTERVDAIRNRSMKLIYPFEYPEKKLFYLAEFDSDGQQIEKLAFMYPNQRQFDWPIPDNLDFNFSLIEKPTEFRLFEYSRERNRCAIELIFEAEDLQNNMQIWAFKNLLLPFAELIKTAILSGTIHVNPNNIDAKLKLGFTKVEHKCIRSILEFDLNPQLDGYNSVIQNIENTYLMLDADTSKEEMLEKAESFSNKKLVPDMIKILRSVISNKGILKSQFATTDEEFDAIVLNRANAKKKKKWLEVKISDEPYTQQVTGVLTMINFETRKEPLFALHSTLDDQKYFGKICTEIAENIDEQTFKFNSTEYKCLLEVVYSPETPLAKEKYEYKLLSITEEEDSVDLI